MSRGTILIIGREDDPCCKAVRGELDASGQAVLFLQEDAILPGLRFVWEPGCPAPRGQVGQSDRVISLSDVRGVLCRSFGVPVPLEEFYSPDGRYVTAEWNALLMAWLSALECSVVNRLRPELWYKIRLDPPDLAALVP